MKILYLDCGMGAAGDMLAAALLELLPNPEEFVHMLNGLGLPGVCIRKEPSVKCGITGTHFSVTVDGKEESAHDHSGQEHPYPFPEHGHHSHHGHRPGHVHSPHHKPAHPHGHHSSLCDIMHIVRDQLLVPEHIKESVAAIYSIIAEAESHVHGVPVTEIHFHEIGAMDAVADIAAVCLLMDRIAPDEVVVSPVHVGSGQVSCAHGILPVPAPATAHILRDIPIYSSHIRGELCTPTGAALLKYFATHFGDMPVMRTSAIGYGMGKKDFNAANCVRALLGEAADKTDTVLELSCNVDDMMAEQIGFAMDRLFDDGALDVYTIPIGMKKSRPGTLLRVICREQEREKLVALIFKHTTTTGIREIKAQRYILDRNIVTLETPYGTVCRKDSSGYGVARSKYEYEDLARIAREKNISIAEVLALLGS